MRRALPTLAPLPLVRRREPFDDPKWVFEPKLDGFRAVAYVQRGGARLVSRNGRTFKRFAPLAAALADAVGVRDAILDGEIVCLDGDGRSRFDALLYRRGEPTFVAFDVLWLDGKDLRDLPLVQRKRVLRRVVPRRATAVRYLDHFPGRGVALFAAACELDLEGVVAKPKGSTYHLVGARSPWIKIKNAGYSQADGRHERFERRGVRRAR